MDCRESSLAAFMDVSGLVINDQSIVQADAKVLTAPHHLHWHANDGKGAMRDGGCIAGELLGDVEEEDICGP